MTERRHPCEHRWDPVILDGILPRGASFSDLDAFTEIDGRFLFIEHKPTGYSWDPSNGQYKALKRLARQPGCTVLFVRDTAVPGWYEVRALETGEPMTQESLQQLRDRVGRWAAP